MTVKWICVAGCPASLLPNEGELVAIYNGRDAWLSHWKSVLADESLRGHVTYFAAAEELTLPTPKKPSNTNIDEVRAAEATRQINKKKGLGK